MCLKSVFVVLLTIVSVSLAQKPTVSVYYEVLCPDSQRFITQQFYPAYTKLAEYFKVDLLPYGKAIQNKVNGRWEFDCQHGPNECYSNKIHACVLKNPSITERQQLKFINCVMGDSQPVHAGAKCASLSGIDWTEIESCSNTEEGSRYLAEFGDRTHALSPKISFVPTIVFNGEYDDIKQRDSLSNFEVVLCSHLKHPKPATCLRRFGGFRR